MFARTDRIDSSKFISTAKANEMLDADGKCFRGKVAVYVDDTIASGDQVVRVFSSNPKILQAFDRMISLPMTANPIGIDFSMERLNRNGKSGKFTIAISPGEIIPSMITLQNPKDPKSQLVPNKEHPFIKELIEAGFDLSLPKNRIILNLIVSRPGYRRCCNTRSFFYMVPNGDVFFVELFCKQLLGLKGSSS